MTQNTADDPHRCDATEKPSFEYDDRHIKYVYVAQGDTNTQTCTFVYEVREYR